MESCSRVLSKASWASITPRHDCLHATLHSCSVLCKKSPVQVLRALMQWVYFSECWHFCEIRFVKWSKVITSWTSSHNHPHPNKKRLEMCHFVCNECRKDGNVTFWIKNYRKKKQTFSQYSSLLRCAWMWTFKRAESVSALFSAEICTHLPMWFSGETNLQCAINTDLDGTENSICLINVWLFLLIDMYIPLQWVPVKPLHSDGSGLNWNSLKSARVSVCLAIPTFHILSGNSAGVRPPQEVV